MHSRSFLRAKAACLLLLLLLIAGSLFAQPVQAAGQEGKLTVTSYETEIEVFEDKSLQIEERFQIHFNVARHGPSFGLTWFYQDKPLIPSMVRGQGDLFFHFRDFVQAYDEYRFGNPFSTYPAGTDKEYSLSYRYQWPADDDPTGDELYWNIINTERPYVHESVKFKFTLPKSFDANQVYITSGRANSTDQTRVDWQVQGNSIVGRLRGQLDPNEAITLKVHLPEGYFSKARPISIFELYLRLFLIPVQFMPLLILPLGFLLWSRLGRKRSPVPVVEFYAPQELNCAEAAWTYFGNSYLSDFSSLIVNWAERGFLTIEERADKSLWLHRLVVEPVPAPAYEQELYKQMFALGDESQVSVKQLSNRFYESIKIAHTGMLENSKAQQPVYTDSNQKLVKKLRRLAWLAALAPFYYIARMALFGDIELAIYGMIFFIITLFVFKPRFQIPQKEKRRTKKTTVANGGYPLGPERGKGSFWANLLLMSFLVMSFLAFRAPTVILSWLFSMVVLYKLVLHSGRQTEYGLSLQGRLEGFREFIRTAELDRIKMLVRDNPSYFFDVLPYAATLGVADDWISKFRQITIPRPQWYSSASISDYNRDYYDMGIAMEGTLKSINTMATIFPKTTRFVVSSSSSDSSDYSSSDTGSAGGGGGGSSMGDW